MKLADEAELVKLKMNFYRLVNFILAVGIISAGTWSIYKIGHMIWS